MEKISVLLTTYNGEKTIEKTIRSILDQEGINRDFEVELIVVDDCSTDRTVSIVRQFDCLLYLNEENSGGPNKGRNTALRAATGDYICIADQDDVWKKHKLKTMLPFLKEVPVVTSGYRLVNTKDGKEEVRVRKTGEKFVFYEKNKTFLSKLSKSLKGQQTYLGSIIYRSELKNILFEENFGMVDFDWILRLFHQRTSIEVCSALYVRYVDGNNLSRNENYRRKDFYYSLFTIEEYENDYPSEVAICYRKLHGSRARYYYLMGNMKKARFFFRKAQFNPKNVFYYLTTFAGHTFVKKHFNVFG